MKIALICDLHMPKFKTAMQYEVLDWAIETIKSERPDFTIVAGDITAYGELDAFYHFKDKINELAHIITPGNSDIRDLLTKQTIMDMYPDSLRLKSDDYDIFCLNSPTTHLDDKNRKFLSDATDGSVIISHHNLEAFDDESGDFLSGILEDNRILFISAHKHKDIKSSLGKSTIIGIRGLDPDKVFGLPSVSFFEFNESGYNYYDKYYNPEISENTDFKDFVGMSCYNLEGDLDYVIENKIKSIEIRLRTNIEDLNGLKKKISLWRDSGGTYLSVHMPDLKAADGTVSGVDIWQNAAKLALDLKANGITIHVPKALYSEMLPGCTLWREFSNIMFDTISRFDSDTKVGIENLHLTKGMKNDTERIFGCIPQECITWINELNHRFGFERVGAVFDIGHASNNGILSSIYPRSTWYEMIGKKTVAYHIHQVVRTPNGLSNHKAIENWYGMNISYVSFLMAWEKSRINHVPMFLEMSNPENVEKSLKALKKFLDKGGE